MSVTNIGVTGERATAVVATTRSTSPSEATEETDPFVNENGAWKAGPTA